MESTTLQNLAWLAGVAGFFLSLLSLWLNYRQNVKANKVKALGKVTELAGMREKTAQLMQPRTINCDRFGIMAD